MMTDEAQVEALVKYARDLPAGTVLPVSRELVLALAADLPMLRPAAVVPAVDQNVGQLALRFGRKDSTVREWCEAGLFPGAYKLRGREWRVPFAGVLAFEKQERIRGRRRSRGRIRLVGDSESGRNQ